LLAGAAALGVSGLASACGAEHGASAPVSPAPAAPAPPQAAALRARFETLAAELKVPGAAMVVRTPDGESATVYGVRALGGSNPVTLADHVRIGSVTKTFTTTVVLQLAQEGKLDIDAPVAEYRADVPNGKNIPLTQLLTMRSGLYNYSESLELNRALDDDPGKVWTPEELVALGLRHPPYFPPGAGYHYSNTNTVLLGLIAEQVDRQPLGAAFQARLFAPVGMRESSFPAADSNAIPAPHPEGYMYGTNVETMEAGGLPPDQRADGFAGKIKPHDVTEETHSWAWAAGGAISTAADLVSWGTALGNGSLLNAEWQRRRLESILPIDPKNPNSVGYGLGIARFGPMYGHTGELPGFQTFCGYDPERKNALVVWANLNAAPDGRPPASTIAQQLISLTYG
jgi:D-alanyl-D-alanine carboxypeptidase